MPDDDCLLHGDFHPNNILVMPNGTPVIIDFMNVCHGPALYDVARTYVLIKEYDGSLADRYLKEIDVSTVEKNRRETYETDKTMGSRP